jgi:Ca2+-binding RTX toxin-like protein
MLEDGTRNISASELLVGVPELGPTASVVSLSIATGGGSLEAQGGTSWLYRPVANDDSAVSFSFTASNGLTSATLTAQLDITPVNDAPVLTPINPALNSISEDDVNNQGQTVASIIGTSISDPDGPSVPRGIAITGASTANGHFEFSVDGGTTWTAFGTYSMTSALLLDQSSLVRFVPDGNNGGSSTFTYYAWDETITFGNTNSVTPGGGTTPYSTAHDTAHVTVNSVNDAPVLRSVAASANYTELTSAVTLAPGIKVSDVDNDMLMSASVKIAGGPVAGDVLSVNGATSGLSNGIAWAYNAATGELSFSGTATKAAYELLLSEVQFSSTSHDPTAKGTALTRAIEWHVSDGSLGNDAATTTINVTGIDDVPVASPVELAQTAEDTPRLITSAELLAGVTDVDSSGLSILSLSIVNGHGNLVAHGNGTWTYTPAHDDDSDITFSYLASDGHGVSGSTAHLDITPVNDGPTAVWLQSTGSFAENTSTDTPLKVADILVSDDNLGTNSFALSGADAKYFQIVGDAVYFKPGTVLDFESKPSYVISVVAHDDSVGPNVASAPLTVHLTDVSPEPVTGTPRPDTLNGGSDADEMRGLASGDHINGKSGNDMLNGGDGNDVLTGGVGRDTLQGGGGNDTLVVSGQDGIGDVFAGGTGVDTLRVSGHGALTLTGFSAGSSSIEKWQGYGNVLFGTNASNVFDFSKLTGETGLKGVFGLNGNDVLIGSKFTDNFHGGNGNDVLVGNAGLDQLIGDAGNDRLNGGLGKDSLAGGAGADVFDFDGLKDSVTGRGRDYIKDFHHGDHDLIDLKNIDADTHKNGNQAFHFIGGDAFSHQAGELRLANHVLQGDVDGNGKADFEISLNVTKLVGSDFIL